MFPLGNAPNWQRLIDGIKACCEDPGMDVVVACHDREERLVVHARGESVSIPYAALMAAAGNERVRPALFIPGPRIEILAEAARLGGVQFLHTECSVAATEVVMELLKWVES